MKTQVYQLDCLTNLHVGDGEASYNIIDNQVQRDVVLNVPTIHSSGIKGSLRQYVKQKHVQQDDCDQTLQKLFGGESEKGKLKFFAGNLITRPLRISCGTGGYVNATCPMIIENEWGFLQAMGMVNGKELKLPLLEPGQIIGSKPLGTGIWVEEMEVKQVVPSADFPILKKMAGEKWVLLNDDDFQSFELPVQARNRLDNGISQALWYEEIVPHKSRFYMAVTEEIGNSGLDCLDNIINNQVVQFGASASIGYGYCKVTKVDWV